MSTKQGDKWTEEKNERLQTWLNETKKREVKHRNTSQKKRNINGDPNVFYRTSILRDNIQLLLSQS